MMRKYRKLSYYTRDFVKLISGDPSLIFHILAEPSMDVKTKNSESKLHEKGRRTISEDMNIGV